MALGHIVSAGIGAVTAFATAAIVARTMPSASTATKSAAALVVGVAAVAATARFSTKTGKPTGKLNSGRRFAKGLPFKHALMSHRGGSLEHVENTLPGFRYSANVLKADLLELDVHLTRDGHAVVFHDNDLARMCGEEFKGKSIDDFDYHDLPPIKIPAHLQDKPDVVNNPDSTRIPLFAELVREFPQYPMQVDVKNGSETLVLQVGRLIQFYKREHLTVWGSFLPKPNSFCYKHFGTSIPLFFCATRFLRAWGLYKLGLLGWMDIYETAVIMPGYATLLSPGLMKALNARGVSVIVFGPGSGAVNTPEGWEAIRAAGANGICSDAPTKLQEWLKVHDLAVCADLGAKRV